MKEYDSIKNIYAQIKGKLQKIREPTMDSSK